MKFIFHSSVLLLYTLFFFIACLHNTNQGILLVTDSISFLFSVSLCNLFFVPICCYHILFFLLHYLWSVLLNSWRLFVSFCACLCCLSAFHFCSATMFSFCMLHLWFMLPCCLPVSSPSLPLLWNSASLHCCETLMDHLAPGAPVTPYCAS